MGNIRARLTKLENQTLGAVHSVVIRPGETTEQARERYLSEFPERRSARLLLIQIKGRGEEGRQEKSGE